MLDRLLRCPGVVVVGVVLSLRVLRKRYGWLRGAREQIRLTGLHYGLYLWVATGLADALTYFSRVPCVTRQARRHRLPVCATRDINAAVELAYIRTRAPDVLLSGFFNQRIGDAVCAAARLGAFNIHPGALPTFKGVDPVFQALRSDKNALSVSLHRITPEFDAGPVMASVSLPRRPALSLLRQTATLFDRGMDLFEAGLPAIAAGASGVTQCSAGRYDSWPSAAQVHALQRRGTPLVKLDDLLRMARGTLVGH
jgi:methionyl-tRNA formyltransferase